MIFFTYFFIMKMIYSHISFTYMFVPTWFDAALVFLYTIYLGGNIPAFSLPTYHKVFYAIVHYADIYDFSYLFLQEELYSYCNRVKRSILEVSYRHIAVYKFYYLDKKICFISIWKQKSIDYKKKKDAKRLFKSVS